MIQTAIDKWSALPVWAKWGTGIGAIVLIEAVGVASQERNFAAGLVEHTVALVLRYGLMALGFGGGIWLGAQVARRSKPWLGWVAGAAFAFVVLGVGMNTITSIPGIGWRVTAMMGSDCYVDWDGRSNPRGC